MSHVQTRSCCFGLLLAFSTITWFAVPAEAQVLSGAQRAARGSAQPQPQPQPQRPTAPVSVYNPALVTTPTYHQSRSYRGSSRTVPLWAFRRASYTARTSVMALVAGIDGGWGSGATGYGSIDFRAYTGSFECPMVSYALYAEDVRGSLNHVGLLLTGIGGLFISEETVALRLFAGVETMHGENLLTYGFQVGGEFTWNFGEPLFLSIQTSGGTIGRAGLLEVRATLGIMIGEYADFHVAYRQTTMFGFDGGDPANIYGPSLGFRFYVF